jgi:Flp pilus assembly protein TadD/cell division protein FtsN
MNRNSMLRLTASVLAFGSTMMLGSVSGLAAGTSVVSQAQAARQAAGFAAKASKALLKKNPAKAVVFAENAVALQARNADYRMILGQAYIAAGRFQSAEQSFSDTLTLNPEKERAALNLALAQVALGKNDAAQSTLADYRDKLPAADFGLAMALAGNPQEAVRVLEFATRAPDANAKTRQNLALAYALAGRWDNAKVMAVQDLTPDEVDTRLATWAGFARPGGSAKQVAALLGVSPVAADGGQPTRLALASPVAPVAVAAAAVEAPAPAPVEVAVAEPTPPAPVAIVDTTPAFETPAPVAVAKAEPVKVAPAPAPKLIRAEPRPVRQAVVQPSRPAALVRPAVAIKAAAFRTTKGGQFVVQIGAFQNASSAERAWTRLSARLDLASYDAVNGAAKARNANLVRVAIGSFGSRAEADRLCARIKQTGNVCFVRVQSGDAPARWVQKHTYKVASR